MSEFLKTDITYLKGVGPKRAELLYAQNIRAFEDLLNYFPRRYLDKTAMKSIAALREGETATVVGEVRSVKLFGDDWKHQRFVAQLWDKTGRIDLVWFQGARYFSKAIKEGDALAAYGKVGMFNGRPQLTHPDIDKLSDGKPDETDGEPQPNDFQLFNTGKIIAIYPTTDAMKRAGLNTRAIRRLMRNLIEQATPNIAENLPSYLIERENLMELWEAYREIHFPSSKEKLEQARYRLKWTELFYMQLLFALRKKRIETQVKATPFEVVGDYVKKLYESLPYEMTNAQKRVIKEIRADMKSGSQMNRLLQGDVGSGKTLVAIFAMMIALDNKAQCAFMAPTEILATQHYITLKKFVEPLGAKIVLLVGQQRKKLREELLASIASGEAQIVVGTHALIEEKVEFKNLGLAIIDEQHRFGVMQRKALQDKATNPHILLMTATPIPRTLTMTQYGDLDVSIIDEMPKNRKPIITYLRHESERDEVLRKIKEEIRKGRQAYIVYPLVEESEKVDLAAAVQSYEDLKNNVFDECRVGLIHGKMLPYEKEDEMEMFRSGKTRVLVGTTVIEVGVDVPNATIMMIEHAERFGLAQLHQLRGRVGRGSEQSYCYLVYGGNLSPDAKERLRAMEQSNDGFYISEVDARLRGAGNILGAEQSGHVSDLKIANLNEDYETLRSAKRAAFELVAQDPQLRKPEHQKVRAYYLEHYHERFGLADVG
ncbi:MAG: ATP-dependent DNA helicase RecG [Chloroherpetonaceae bacterium]|nr:ATP-dependent DNA helicase RecG [Chloroherpetonaceae bacterium]MDW8437701.1 ATP-dependent DNA helicase RecG [Chloroherpetonaceae bacterium]